MDKTNNQYLEKIKIAQELLTDNASDLEQAKEFISKADSKYIGRALEQEIKRWTEDKEQREVMAEALDHYIWELENFLKLDARGEGVETTETKVASELLNEPQ